MRTLLLLLGLLLLPGCVAFDVRDNVARSNELLAQVNANLTETSARLAAIETRLNAVAPALARIDANLTGVNNTAQVLGSALPGVDIPQTPRPANTTPTAEPVPATADPAPRR